MESISNQDHIFGIRQSRLQANISQGNKEGHYILVTFIQLCIAITKMADMHSLREEKFILAYGFRGSVHVLLT